jgi:segregation and condensation protein B
MKTPDLINAILFLKGRTGSTIKELSSILKIKQKDIKVALDTLILDLQKPNSIYLVKLSNETYRLTLKHDIANLLSTNLDKTYNIKLSRSVLETLTIIAYNQPTTKPIVDDVRGVSSDYAIRKLLDFELIEEDGRSDSIGQPKLYKTTNKFLELFDITNLTELPPMKDTVLDETEAVNLFEYD